MSSKTNPCRGIGLFYYLNAMTRSSLARSRKLTSHLCGHTRTYSLIYYCDRGGRNQLQLKSELEYRTLLLIIQSMFMVVFLRSRGTRTELNK
jgi:hypothetical protein